MTRRIAALIVAVSTPAAAQILANGDFSGPDLEPWRFLRDITAEPYMVAMIDEFEDRRMFRLNPGHDGSGGWAGGTLQQTIHLLPGTYYLSGSFYIQNLRTGTNSSGGIVTVEVDGRTIFTKETTSVGGLAIVHIPVNDPFRIEREGEYTLSIRFKRPWRNSSPVSIYHWAGDLAVKLPFCYANCDDSTSPPLLSVDDFTCFIDAFAHAQSLSPEEQVEHYANCDGSTTEPILTVDDFTCFIDAFARGCP